MKDQQNTGHAKTTSSEGPDYTASRATNGNFDHTDGSLSGRFAKLRVNSNSPRKTTENELHFSNGIEPSITNSVTSASRPSRPTVTPVPNTGLPKPPSPTYTPTKGSPGGIRVQPPRNPRITRYDRPQSAVSNASSSLARPTSSGAAQQPTVEDHRVTDGSGQQIRRRRAASKPQETDVSARKLYDYLQTFNVLLIDIRSRAQFDSGHIASDTIICVEPAALRHNMSAEELHESLVLSPEEEQRLFDRRNEFDIVVYYDQDAHISDWGPHRQKRANPALKYLYDALYDYNQEKPLHFPPILLNGGIEAWIDLVGTKSLFESNTAQRPRNAPAISRRPVMNLSARMDTQKRRHRDYNPLDPEEEQKWRERARSESIVLDQRPHAESKESPDNTEDGNAPMPDYDDFVRRFPDVAAVEEQQRQQMRTNGGVSHVPNYPTPQPPTAPQSLISPAGEPSTSSIPSTVPALPAPAVPRRTYSGVSDRLTQPAAPTKPPKLAPYIPPRLKRIPRTGLHNFGVTCYMNATIQCMSATIPVTAYFLDGQFQRDIQRDNWKGSKGLMPELYYTLLRNLWESYDVEIIRPTNFRKFCGRLNKEWGIDRQQDAKEYLEFLIDGLHEDLNINWRRNPLRPLTDEEEQQRERMPPFVASKIEWGRYEHRDHSRLTDYFAGQHLSKLTCNVCHTSSTTYEPFYSISVEIPNISRRPIDIRDCLRSYCSTEILSGEDIWKCPKCKCDREATKRITITRAPENLVIHFKRFSASHSQSAKKITAPIEFPLRDLDLEPYMLPPPDAQLASEIARGYGADRLQSDGSMRPPFKYDCYAVMRHIGNTIASGHYIALVKDAARRTWREFNDDKVRDFQPDELSSSRRLQNEQAYIVFYSRVRTGG